MATEEVINIEFDPKSLELALEENNISQADLARILGYKHRNTVNKIIKGKRELTANDLLRISAFLQKSPDKFARAD